MKATLRAYPEVAPLEVDMPWPPSTDALSRLTREYIDPHPGSWWDLWSLDHGVAAVWLSDGLITPEMWRVPSGRKRAGTRFVQRAVALPDPDGLEGERVFLGATLVFRQRQVPEHAAAVVRSLCHLPTVALARAWAFGRERLLHATVDGVHLVVRETMGAPDRCYTAGNTPPEIVEGILLGALDASDALHQLGAVAIVPQSLHPT